MDTSMEPARTGSNAASPRQHQQWHCSLRRTPLERLPIELIQKIFFECLEVNLPRASLPIALALSNEAIFTWLIRLAFSSNNESARTGFFTKLYLPFDYFSLTASERAVLQTEILKCRWCSLPLMRKCQREHVEHVLRQKCSRLIISPAGRRQLENLEPHWQSMDRFNARVAGSRGSGDLTVEAREPPPPQPPKRANTTTSTTPASNPGANANGNVNASISTINTTTTTAHSSHSDVRKIAIWFNFGSVQIRERSPIFQETDVFRLPSCAFREPCRMPDRLLCPPWTPEKLEFLTLLSTEAYIDDDHRHDRSKAVLRQVIVDRDLETFKHLVGMHIRVKIYGYPLLWPVRQTHYRVAARHADSTDDDPFLNILFTDRKAEVPSNDPSIRALMARYEHHSRQREMFGR
ncbi:hypothetical protein AJ79_04689 [Helicocarpus griseus UAMH5409]|uniref:Uncharacterized protein n=1 Tax=Helicocarpus griseus UAMH5409 TaxID=1447875 RepID=A0A2B7XT72_9EURO|nr:hypothetical protein AJ79_04689 [Helicocarpus griseus UAMH5409]